MLPSIFIGLKRIVTRITEHLLHLQKRIAAAASLAGRDSAEIRILAVSKQHPASVVREAQALGLASFGENYVQEALEKMAALGPGPEWHFIGRIQSNKTRPIAGAFDWVQTVSTLRIARRLSEQRPQEAPKLQICIQVQLDPEGRHGGVPPTEVEALASEALKLPRLKLRGLMGMPLAEEDSERRRIPYRELRALFDDMNERGYGMDTLSMGMSADLEAAVLEGTTMLRIGTDLLGPREG